MGDKGKHQDKAKQERTAIGAGAESFLADLAAGEQVTKKITAKARQSAEKAITRLKDLINEIPDFDKYDRNDANTLRLFIKRAERFCQQFNDDQKAIIEKAKQIAIKIEALKKEDAEAGGAPTEIKEAPEADSLTPNEAIEIIQGIKEAKSGFAGAEEFMDAIKDELKTSPDNDSSLNIIIGYRNFIHEIQSKISKIFIKWDLFNKFERKGKMADWPENIRKAGESYFKWTNDLARADQALLAEEKSIINEINKAKAAASRQAGKQAKIASVEESQPEPEILPVNPPEAVPTPEPAPTAPEAQEITAQEKIASAKNFDELYAALREIGSIEDYLDGKTFDAERIIRFIDRIRMGAGRIDRIARNFGLRTKVSRLLKEEQSAKGSEPALEPESETEAQKNSLAEARLETIKDFKEGDEIHYVRKTKAGKYILISGKIDTIGGTKITVTEENGKNDNITKQQVEDGDVEVFHTKAEAKVKLVQNRKAAAGAKPEVEAPEKAETKTPGEALEELLNKAEEYREEYKKIIKGDAAERKDNIWKLQGKTTPLLDAMIELITDKQDDPTITEKQKDRVGEFKDWSDKIGRENATPIFDALASEEEESTVEKEKRETEEGQAKVEEILVSSRYKGLTSKSKAAWLLTVQKKYNIERKWFFDHDKIENPIKKRLKDAWAIEDKQAAAAATSERTQPPEEGTAAVETDVDEVLDAIEEELAGEAAPAAEGAAPEGGEPLPGEEGMTPEQRQNVRAGLAGIGFYARKYKSQTMAGVLNWLAKERKTTDEAGNGIVLDIADRTMLVRFTKSMAETYEKDAARAQRGLDAIVERKRSGKGAGVWNTTRSAALAVGMVTKLIRTGLELSGASVLLPRRYIMMGAMGAARGAESLKEARFKGKELRKKTEEINFEGLNGCSAIIEGIGDWLDKKAALENLERRFNLTDSEKEWIKVIAAFKEADRDENGRIIQHSDANGGLIGTSISDAYKKMYGEKSYKELTESEKQNSIWDKSKEIFAKSANNQVEKYVAKVAKKIKKIEDNANLSEEDKQSQKEAVLSKYQEQLQEYDKMVTQFGEVDGWAMGLKQAERISKAAVTALTIEALALGAFHVYDTFFGHHGELEKIGELEDRLTASRDARAALEKEWGKGIDLYAIFGKAKADSAEKVLAELRKTMPPRQWQAFQGEMENNKGLTNEDKSIIISGLAEKWLGGAGVATEPGTAVPETGAAPGVVEGMTVAPTPEVTAASTPEVAATAPTPEIPSAITPEQISLATIHAGKGIENAFINQLKADPERFGFTGKSSELNHWAGVRAHQLAEDFGYVKGSAEVRVGTAGIDKAAFVLTGDKDHPLGVQEYFEGKPIEVHAAGTTFEGAPGEKIEEYEYLKGAAKAAKKAAEAGRGVAENITEVVTDKEVVDGTALIEQHSAAFDSLNHQMIVEAGEPGQTELPSYSVDLIDANKDGIPDQTIFRLGDSVISEESYESGQFADSAAFEKYTEQLGAEMATAGGHIDEVADRLNQPGNRILAVDFISNARGTDVNIAGFDYSGGIREGSAFETLINNFNSNRDLFIDVEGKIDPTQFKVFKELTNLKADSGLIFNILNRTKLLDNVIWQNKEAVMARLMAFPNSGDKTSWLKELFGRGVDTGSARASVTGSGITFSNINGQTVAFNFNAGIIKVGKGLGAIFGGETFKLDQIGEVISKLSSD